VQRPCPNARRPCRAPSQRRSRGTITSPSRSSPLKRWSDCGRNAKHEGVHAFMEDVYTRMSTVVDTLVHEVMHTSCGMYNVLGQL